MDTVDEDNNFDFRVMNYIFDELCEWDCEYDVCLIKDWEVEHMPKLASKTCSEEEEAKLKGPWDKPFARKALELNGFHINWGRYRKAPFTYKVEDLETVIGKIDKIFYMIASFCPPADTKVKKPYFLYPKCDDMEDFEWFLSDGNDPKEILLLQTYKEINPNLKISVAVGGWNFPSAIFSEMANNEEYREKWVKQVKIFVDKY